MTVAVTVALALLFTLTGSGKVTGHSVSLQMRDHHGVSETRWRQLGAAELAGALGVLLGLWIPAIGVAAAVGLGLVAAGGLVAHVGAGDPPARMIPAVAGLALAAATAVLQGAGL